MALPAPDVSLVTKKYSDVNSDDGLEDIQIYLSKIIPGFNSGNKKIKDFYFYKTEIPKFFRLIGNIEHVGDGCLEIKVTKCDHFKEIGFNPKAPIRIFKVSDKILQAATIEKYFSGYCKVDMVCKKIEFCLFSNTHNKIRFHRKGDIDVYFISEDDDEYGY